MKDLTNWDNSFQEGGCGVITGCDNNHEWMLKWWWENYSKHNSYPVTIFDFGMTLSAKIWCEQHFRVIPFNFFSIEPQKNLSFKGQKIWEKLYGPTVWKARANWFKKPFVFLKTPYNKTVWLDIDCQVLKPIDFLFNINSSIGMAYEVERFTKKFKKYRLLLPNEEIFNTGVVSYLRGESLISEWAKRTISEYHLFLGDQDIISRIIYEKNVFVTLLPENYNRRPRDGVTSDTYILHFVCNGGKAYLLKTLQT